MATRFLALTSIGVADTAVVAGVSHTNYIYYSPSQEVSVHLSTAFNYRLLNLLSILSQHRNKQK